MKVSREEKKAEALKRMKNLGYWGRAREAFRRSDKVFVNEPPFGAVYDLDDELREEVVKFEEEHDALVYCVVRSFTTIGKMDSLLYVSDYREEWPMDNEDLKEGYTIAYVINHDMPDCSELGGIVIRLTLAGGLQRVS